MGVCLGVDRLTVLYDRDCGFCRWTLAKLLAWDRRGRLHPAEIQGREGDRLLEAMDAERRLASMHVVTSSGEVRSGGDGLPLIFDALPGGRPLGALLGRLPGFSDRLYRQIAGRRSAIGPRIPAAAKERADRRIASRS